MIIDELNKKIADIESLANDKTSTIESKVSDLTDGLLMVADAVDIIPEMVDEKITAITKEFSTIKETVSKVKAKKGDKGDRGEPGIDGIGIKGDDGKDGSPDTGEQIVDKINELEGVLDTKVLKDFSMPDVKDLERQINTIGNQTLRLLSRPTTTTSSSFTGVTTDATLTGLGTDTSPLSVVATSASDVAVTVRAATTAALAGTWTYDNGTSGVGATLTRTTNGVLPNQDGISLSDGDRFLIKNQASTLANGVYVLTQKGVASVSPTIFTRATDADETSELDELVVTISEGSTNRGTVWGQQTNNPTVGTSAIVFATVVSTAVTQATSGTQAINQIPLYTGTARQLTRGTANFKYNPTTDLFTIRGIDYTFPANNGDASQVLTTDGSGTLSWEAAGGGGTPAGSDTQVQFNDAGAFGGDSWFTFDKTTSSFRAGNRFNKVFVDPVSGNGGVLLNNGFQMTIGTVGNTEKGFLVDTGGSYYVGNLANTGTKISVDSTNESMYLMSGTNNIRLSIDDTNKTISLAEGSTTNILVDNDNQVIELTTNGDTNYASDIPKSIKVTISSAEILDLNTTPKELIPAPGAGKVIQVLSILSNYTYGTVTYATATNLEYLYGAAATSTYTDTTSLASTVNLLAYPTATPPGEVYSNSNLNLHVQSANPTAGDGTLDIYLTYRVVTL